MASYRLSNDKVLLEPTSPFTNLHLVPSFDVPVLAAIAASTVVLPASGTLLAAYRPASGDPDAVIRE
jgi:hypothetical protein